MRITFLFLLVSLTLLAQPHDFSGIYQGVGDPARIAQDF